MTKSRGIREHDRNLVGQSFGSWTVIKKGPKNIFGFAHWVCKCQCGKIKNVAENSLVHGKSKSCGCIAIRGRHHESKKTKLYSSWTHMLSRCNNPHAIGYVHYGGRGISVCKRWLTYENFRDDMGPHPGEGYSIDRINNDGNYEPKNCRWATRSQQSSNQQEAKCSECGKICRSGAGLRLHTRIHA